MEREWILTFVRMTGYGGYDFLGVAGETVAT
jgi:hypothetical protein